MCRALKIKNWCGLCPTWGRSVSYAPTGTDRWGIVAAPLPKKQIMFAIFLTHYYWDSRLPFNRFLALQLQWKSFLKLEQQFWSSPKTPNGLTHPVYMLKNECVHFRTHSHTHIYTHLLALVYVSMMNARLNGIVAATTIVKVSYTKYAWEKKERYTTTAVARAMVFTTTRTQLDERQAHRRATHSTRCLFEFV